VYHFKNVNSQSVINWKAAWYVYSCYHVNVTIILLAVIDNHTALPSLT